MAKIMCRLTEWDDLFEELKKKHEMELNKSNKE